MYVCMYVCICRLQCNFNSQRIYVGMRNEDDRLKSRSENQHFEIQRKHNNDVSMLKERFQREEKQLIEMAEKDRKNENDASLDTCRHMREVEDKQTR